MNRRAFLQLAGAAAAAFALDPERLLWRPGAKTIFLPPERKVFTLDVGGGVLLQRGDIIQIVDDGYGNRYYAVNPLTRQSTGQLQTFVVTSDATGPVITLDILHPPVHDNGIRRRGPRRQGKVDPLFVGEVVAEGQSTGCAPDGSWACTLTPRDRGWSHKRT